MLEVHYLFIVLLHSYQQALGVVSVVVVGPCRCSIDGRQSVIGDSRLNTACCSAERDQIVPLQELL